MVLQYNSPTNGQPSSIDQAGGEQFVTYKYLRKAIIESEKEQFFLPLASVEGLPKNSGKTIVRYVWVPLLDDRNINDQGIDAAGVTTVNGNLYGSSKDVGLITDRLPVLGADGGRVNRVGFTRLTLEGSIEEYGFFYDFNKEALDFDTDEGLMEHLSREMVRGAHQITETLLQLDILANANTIVYPGAADSLDTITAEVDTSTTPPTPAGILTHANLSRLDTVLNKNNTPRQTTMIKGSLKVDTRTVSGGRIAYIGYELVQLVRSLRDQFGNPAFIPTHQYADAGSILNGEIGSAGEFRFIVHPEMLHYAGQGAVVTNNPGYKASNVGGVQRYDVFPIVVVGDDAFNTIGFQTNGKTFKFNIITKMPGKDMADLKDPYGKRGFSSLQFWYGFLANRPERLAVIYTVAPI